MLSSAAADGEGGAVRIALVAGSGGLGKTSLAVHAAHRVRDSFPDGQLYVDLLGATPHPLGAGDVLARFLRDLGLDARDIPIDEARQMLGLAAVEVYNFDPAALAPLVQRIGPTPEELGQDDAVSIPKWEAARSAGRHWLTDAEALPDLVQN